MFGQGGGEKLADDLQTKVLGQLPLGQPDRNEEDFAPSVYQEDHPLEKFIKKLQKSNRCVREIIRSAIKKSSPK